MDLDVKFRSTALAAYKTYKMVLPLTLLPAALAAYRTTFFHNHPDRFGSIQNDPCFGAHPHGIGRIQNKLLALIPTALEGYKMVPPVTLIRIGSIHNEPFALIPTALAAYKCPLAHLSALLKETFWQAFSLRSLRPTSRPPEIQKPSDPTNSAIPLGFLDPQSQKKSTKNRKHSPTRPDAIAWGICGLAFPAKDRSRTGSLPAHWNHIVPNTKIRSSPAPKRLPTR